MYSINCFSRLITFFLLIMVTVKHFLIFWCVHNQGTSWNDGVVLDVGISTEYCGVGVDCDIVADVWMSFAAFSKVSLFIFFK